MPTYSAIPLAQTIVGLCKAKEIQQVVISPGSRNAPLIISFTGDSYFDCYSIVDERCAAFFALGLAQQLRHPVALVCTSGSAILNYYPAVAEAFYSDVPLVVISADRPKERIDVGDGQTIRQEFVMQNHILYEANMINTGKESSDVNEANQQLLNDALNTAIQRNGPVHINAPFYEPLYDKVAAPTFGIRSVQTTSRAVQETPSSYEYLLESWNSSERKMILVGTNYPEEISSTWIDLLLTDPSVLMLVETTSNMHHPKIINGIDQFLEPLASDQLEELQPEILITMGGMVVSKKIKAFLRKYKPERHWHIHPKKAYDTFGCLTNHIETTPKQFFNSFLLQTAIDESPYQRWGLDIREDRRKKHKEYVKTIPFSDFKAFEIIFNQLPQQLQLQLSNSSTVRYAQLFNSDPTHHIYCNRGTSGIDGSTSTAIGASLQTDRITTLITGDLSFFYDSNAFWNSYVPKTFKVILINNRGGGIFRILPGREDSDVFSTYFETQHQLTALQLCAMYTLEYQVATNIKNLENGLHWLFTETTGPAVLEVFTPRELNDSVLLDYFTFLR